jgi:hypothetical protein
MWSTLWSSQDFTGLRGWPKIVEIDRFGFQIRQKRFCRGEAELNTNAEANCAMSSRQPQAAHDRGSSEPRFRRCSKKVERIVRA